MRQTKEEITKERDAASRAATTFESRLSYSEKREEDLKKELDEFHRDRKEFEIERSCQIKAMHDHMRFLENLIEANTEIKLRKQEDIVTNEFNRGRFI